MRTITTYTMALNSLLNDSKNNKEEFLIKLNFLSNIFNLNSSAGFIWCGTKLKMADELNDIFDFLDAEKKSASNTGYTTWVDVCGGALNSTLVLMDSLRVSGIKKFIVNDINKCIYQTHLDYKENSNDLITEFSEIIRSKFIIEFGTIFLDKEKFEKVISILVDELRDFELNNDYSVKSSIRFIILRDLTFSGTITFHKDGSFHFAKKIFCGTKVFPWFFRQITRIKKISKSYNDLDIKIYNLDCFELLKLDGIKNNPNVLINLDPPYIQQLKKNEEEYIIELEKLKEENNLTFETLKVSSEKKAKDCNINYNQKFPHFDLLELLPNYNYIYNNNKHPIINSAKYILDSNTQEFDRKETMANKKNQKANIVKETILFKNSLI